MSITSENQPTSAAGGNDADDRSTERAVETAVLEPANLRWWPALFILVLMVAMRMGPALVDTPPFPLMMLGFMGPGVIGGVLILAWWCFGSRATRKEKVVGLFGLLAIAGITISLLHFSMKGMGIVILMLPTGFAAFALTLVVLSRSPTWRLPVALAATVIGFGYWDLKQSEGVTGQFQSQLLWRWQPNAEQRYLRALATRETEPRLDEPLQPVSPDSSPWPAFRGRSRNGVVAGVTLGNDWSSKAPELIWKRKIGPGWSSFSVARDRLYTQEQRGDNEAVVCMNAETGEPLWEHVYRSRFWESVAGAGPRATPTIGNDSVYAFGADGILLRLDASSGVPIWSRDVKVDADREPPTWGFASSPLLVDSLVVVHAGGEGDNGLFAYQVDDGSIEWSVPSGSHSYSSPQLSEFCGQRGILMMTNEGLQFVNPGNGELMWQYALKTENYRALQPLVIGRSVYIATSLQEGTHRVTVSCEPDGGWSVEGDWTSRNMKSEFNDFVHHEGFIYGFDGSIFACVDAETGKRQWKRGRYGNGQVLLLSDSGQLLVTSEKGRVVLLAATPEKLVEKAEFQAIEGKTWNHPVLVRNRLYIRNAQESACYELPLADSEALQ